MADTKPNLEQALADSRAENEKLRGELDAARASASPARVTFPTRPNFRGGAQLSEGERNDLALNGVIVSMSDGRQLLASDYGVEVVTDAGRAALAAAVAKRSAPAGAGEGIEGVTHVWPSVRPGVLAADAPQRGAVPDSAVESK